MRSSGSRVRECGRRGGCLAASLIALAACGDNAGPAHRLAPLRYVYDDGTVQLDHHALYDHTLDSLCTPTLFSDGEMYCMPPADDGFYIDDSCQHAVARVPSGQSPKPFVATTFGLAGALSVSRVYHAGALTDAPQQRWERRDNLCLGMPIDEGFDYYAAGPQVMDLAQLRDGVSDDYDAWQVKRIVGDGVNLPWSFVDAIYGECEIVSRPTATTTWCRPRSEPIVDFEDPQCTIGILVGATDPVLASEGNDECPTYRSVGVDALTANLYQRNSNQACVLVPTSGATRGALVGPIVMMPTLGRERSGPGRIKTITLTPTLATDDLVYDTGLAEDCQRDAQGRCVPAITAPVETWFADDRCAQPIDVAMVRPVGCTTRQPHFARRADTYFDIGAVYGQQLYQLSTGDTCQIYNPPSPQVAHSLGSALGDDAFARATLMIE